MAEENTYFYDWEEIGKKWITSEDAFDTDYPSKPQSYGGSLAAFIIKDIFNLDLESSSENLGSYLPGYDVRDRDAYQMVQLSLTAELVNSRVIECYATEEGKVKFLNIGVNNSTIRNNVLYEINSGQLNAKCDKVLVTGYDPPPKRFTKNNPYNLFTFATKNLDEDTKDKKADEYPRYYMFGEILGPERCDFFREGVIEYGKLDFDMEYSILTDMYDENAYKTANVPQYIYKTNVPFYQAGSTDVNFRNTTSRYIELNKFGILQTRTWKDKTQYMPSMCSPEDELDPIAGVDLPESDDDKFLRVSAVYIWGYLLKNIRSGEKLDYMSSSADLEVDLDTMKSEPFKLNEGQDYLIRKKEEGGYKIVFSCNVSENYKEFFGGPNVKSVYFRIGWNNIFEDQDATRLASPKSPFNNVSGYLRDGKTSANSDSITQAVLFPLNEGQSAYALPLVAENNAPRVIVVYEWDNPSIQITDLRNEVTKENLEQVTAEFYPIIIKDEIAPQVICSNGTVSVLDRTDIIPDRNVETVENFAEKEYTRATQLENGDISLVMPFADEEECKTIAKFIYNKQSEIGEEVTYTCDPDAEPVLGEVIDGNVINSIDYSYQDSSQYLISVKAGTIWQGMNSWNQSLYAMQTESVQEEGIVRSINADNITCHIELKHLGVMECVNISRDKLEKGDKVQVTVQNNPKVLL